MQKPSKENNISLEHLSELSKISLDGIEGEKLTEDIVKIVSFADSLLDENETCEACQLEYRSVKKDDLRDDVPADPDFSRSDVFSDKDKLSEKDGELYFKVPRVV